MATRRSASISLITLLAMAAVPSASTAQPANPFSVAVRANIAPSEAGTSAVVGGSLTYALTERLAVEAEGIYFTTSDVSETWGLALDALVALGPGGWSDDLVPYVVAGVGFERATVTLSDSRFLGPIAPGIGAGTPFCPGSGPTGPHQGQGPGSRLTECPADPGIGAWGVGDLPDFYARRLGVLTVPTNGRWPQREFTDPVLTLGGGVRFTGHSGVFVQPEARIWLAIADGDTAASGLFGLTVGYRF